VDRLPRVIDANLNRAREGLRVLEDLARFELDDAALSESAKQIRHGIRTAAEALGISRQELLEARDTAGDVGTAITAGGEYVRGSGADLAAAAAGRVQEALRVLEEAGKLRSTAAAEIFERLRYQTYTLERDLDAKLRRRVPQWTLCVLLTASLCPGGDWESVARRVVEIGKESGADCIQLREKTLEGREFLARARTLAAMTRPRGISLVINDRPDIAKLSGADGVHLGQTDLAVADARAIVGAGAIVGVSTANLDQARAARRAGADYVGLGPMFPSTTKPKDSLSGMEYLRAFLGDADAGGLPHLAISGITPERAGELARAGCRGIAVSSGVCSAADPGAACVAFRRAMSALVDRSEAANGR
jgi:thiamine-phosphate pyrophosphorylase